jgi:hypothetical protein
MNYSLLTPELTEQAPYGESATCTVTVTFKLTGDPAGCESLNTFDGPLSPQTLFAVTEK